MGNSGIHNGPIVLFSSMADDGSRAVFPAAFTQLVVSAYYFFNWLGFARDRCLVCFPHFHELQEAEGSRLETSRLEITGANAGGPGRFAIRVQWASRIAQFC